MTATEVALLKQELEQANKKLSEILEQTTRTNGRVDKLESWRDKMTGAWIVVSLVSPVIAGLIVSYLSK